MEKIHIWGEEIPFNSKKSKLEDMPVIHKDWGMEQIYTAPDNLFDPNGEVKTMATTDTMVYLTEMLTGNCSMNYDDIPYLAAYPVKDSKYCVLDVPGGAYLSVSMENEGEHVAKRLNELGISVFVLRYRTYPYHYPVMFADCQRALKWLIFHAREYGFDADKISMIGYSAGGNLVGSVYHMFLDQDLLPQGFRRDEIDNVNARTATLAMVYPKTKFTNGSKLLVPVLGLDVMQDNEKRNKAIEEFTLNTKVKEGQVPTFLVNATNDELISSEDVLDYAMRLNQCRVPFEMHNYGRGGHGFGGCLENNPMFPHDKEGVETWMDLYAMWLRKNS